MIVDSTVASNTATNASGGGVLAETGAGGLLLENPTVSGNTATEGGGITIEGPTTIDSSTIAENQGGGVLLSADGGVIRASTIAANTYSGGLAGGIVGGEGYEMAVRSSIVAGNTGSAGAGDCAAHVASNGYNILGTTTTACSWPGGEGDQIGVAPLLGPLADNGGPTETMAPISATSPAINHGGNPKPADQRGRTRPVPAGAEFTDVGAVEVQKPVNEVAPSITYDGDLVEGRELSCEAGEWDGDTVEPSYSYAWLVDGIAAATGSAYELTAADAGKDVVCRVTADNGVIPVAAESAPVELLTVHEAVALLPASTRRRARSGRRSSWSGSATNATPGSAPSPAARNGVPTSRSGSSATPT